MRLLNLVLAASLALAPASALAQARPTPPIASQSDATRMLGRLMEWFGPTNTLMLETQEAWLFIIDGVGKSGEDDMKGAAGRTWAIEWLGQADARIAGLKAKAAALPPLPADLERQFNQAAPEGRRQIGKFKELSVLARTSLDELEAFLAMLRPDLLKAADGDEEAKITVMRKALSGTRLSLKTDNAILGLSVATANRPDNPQSALAGTAILGNDAMALVLGYIEGLLDPDAEPADEVAIGKAIKAKVAAARAEARKIWPNAQRLRRETSAELGPGPLREMLVKALSTYEESQQVELAILDVMDEIADDLIDESGDGVDMESWRLDDMERQSDRRMALQAERSRVVAGQ